MGENDSIVSFESWAAISESFLSIFSRIGKGIEKFESRAGKIGKICWPIRGSSRVIIGNLEKAMFGKE